MMNKIRNLLREHLLTFSLLLVLLIAVSAIAQVDKIPANSSDVTSHNLQGVKTSTPVESLKNEIFPLASQEYQVNTASTKSEDEPEHCLHLDDSIVPSHIPTRQEFLGTEYYIDGTEYILEQGTDYYTLYDPATKRPKTIQPSSSEKCCRVITWRPNGRPHEEVCEY